MNFWTKERPTKEGWYWAQESTLNEPYAIYVDKKLNIFRDSLSRDMERIVLWMPIDMPETPFFKKS
jgi:hypothetical protein